MLSDRSREPFLNGYARRQPFDRAREKESVSADQTASSDSNTDLQRLSKWLSQQEGDGDLRKLSSWLCKGSQVTPQAPLIDESTIESVYDCLNMARLDCSHAVNSTSKTVDSLALDRVARTCCAVVDSTRMSADTHTPNSQARSVAAAGRTIDDELLLAGRSDVGWLSGQSLEVEYADRGRRLDERVFERTSKSEATWRELKFNQK